MPLAAEWRICSAGCGRTLPLRREHFYYNKSRHPGKGFQRQCVYCLRQKMKANNGDSWRRSLYGRYGLTLEEYNRMLDAQCGGCAICGSKTPRGGGRGSVLGVDHCHQTGKVRGILCNQCNHLIGKAGDDPEILRAAIKYLERGA